MADTLGTPFFLPWQYLHSSNDPARGKSQFYQTGGSTIGQAAYKDIACQGPHKQDQRSNGGGRFAPIYLNSDADTEYRHVLLSAQDQDAANFTTEYTIDGVPRIQENFEAGSFECTWVGFSVDPAEETILYYRLGRLVCIDFPTGTETQGTSNATGYSLSGVPTALRPATAQYFFLPHLIDAGAHINGSIKVDTDGTMEFGYGAGHDAAGWTNSGTKGLGVFNTWNMTFFYRLDDA